MFMKKHLGDYKIFNDSTQIFKKIKLFFEN